MTDDPRYPIGNFSFDSPISESDYPKLIAEIERAPELFRAAIKGLSKEQLATPYRDGGWTVTQVIHHVPDSHMNAYCRFKLALTEKEPQVKPYDEAEWAKLADASKTPIEVSLSLLEALHKRWVVLLRSLSSADFQRGYYHPEHKRVFKLANVLAMYAWHGQHHAAHITSLRKRKGW